MRIRALAAALCAAVIPAGAAPPPAHASEGGPIVIAFIGDQGNGQRARAVLELIASEGADAVVHSGDFDYDDDPASWDTLIDSVLGPDFPYFASAGNHDDTVYYGAGGYQQLLEARMQRIGIPWQGDLGVQSEHTWAGIHFVLTAPDVFGPGNGFHDAYISERLAESGAIWRISSWHKNQHLMQAGGKGNEAGWGVYEASRRAGAIIATGHEHSYSRTHLLSDMQNQVVASTDDPLVLAEDDPATPADEGRSFAFVSGLAGRGIRDQETGGPWFASIYTSTQGADYGALFGVFEHGGDPRLAHFYFKNVNGTVVDDFFVRSDVCGDADGDEACADHDNCSDRANASQGDEDRDGYGNACDADYDGSGTVTISDLNIMRAALGAAAGAPGFDAALDHDESGVITVTDWNVMAEALGGPPGPSGLRCAGSPPCAVCPGSDQDGDTVCDDGDNCLDFANPWQIDPDRDGYGAACDADYDGSGLTTVSDFLFFRSAFGSSQGSPLWLPDADHDGSGSITAGDLNRFRQLFNRPPGPSGLSCAGTPPCPGP